MPEQRHVFRLSRSLVVAVPPGVRAHLGVTRGDTVYWHLARGGEAVVTVRPQRVGGHPEGLALQRKLLAAEAELVRLRQSIAARERSLYAEGWNAGAITTQERLMQPHGASAQRARRKRLFAHIFPDAAKAEAKAKRRRSARTEAVPGPDSYPAPAAAPGRADSHEETAPAVARHTPDPSPSPAPSEGEALAPGAKPTGQP